MINKLYRTALLFLCTMVMIVFSSSCAEKDDVLLEEPEEEAQTIEEPTLPEPSWADGVVTITVGRYQEKEALMQAIRDKENFVMHDNLSTTLHKIDVPMAKERKTVDIAVITLEEAGFSEKVTQEQITRRFRQLGYRPLTIEEVLEFRLQFEDQPDLSAKHLTEEERKWGQVITLLSKQDADALNGSNIKGGILLSLYRVSYWDIFREGFCVSTISPQYFNPHDKNIVRTVGQRGNSFAGVVIK